MGLRHLGEGEKGAPQPTGGLQSRAVSFNSQQLVQHTCVCVHLLVNMRVNMSINLRGVSIWPRPVQPGVSTGGCGLDVWLFGLETCLCHRHSFGRVRYVLEETLLREQSQAVGITSSHLALSPFLISSIHTAASTMPAVQSVCAQYLPLGDQGHHITQWLKYPAPRLWNQLPADICREAGT